MDTFTILTQLKEGKISIEDAEKKLKFLPFEDLGYAVIDHQRKLRNGCSEVIYCAGKTKEQTAGIVEKMLMQGTKNILCTRANSDTFEEIKKICPSAEYCMIANIIKIELEPEEKRPGIILVATGGTSDIPVAEEAAVTAEFLGNQVDRLYDVGVAGLHRLLSRLNHIAQANIIIAVAGMEGALPSVIGGLTDKPVIAVPTSVGYGANFQGLSSLLCMLNSCASGVGVVNIDNGFGAGYLANSINRLCSQNRKENTIL